MGRRLRMSAELGDWLAELIATEPVAGADVGAAVTAIMDAEDPTLLALVSVPEPERVDPRQEIDNLYQRLLEALQRVRIREAEAATDRIGAEHLLADLDKDTAPEPAVRAWLSQALATAKRHEASLTLRNQRLQRHVDAFRTTKETAKAMYTAAEASLRIRDAIEIAADDSLIAAERITRYGPQPPPAGDDELAELNRALEAAEAQLHAVAEDAARTLREIQELAGPDGAKDAGRQSANAVADVLELRADPLGRDVRLMYAVEPADVITLLAVLDGEGAISEHRDQAVQLAGDLLSDIRAGEWPPADALGPADLETTFADAAAFLARFFPADGDTIGRRAADLAVARALAALRADRGISIDEVAVETGISVERLQAIEHAGLRVAHVHEAAAYVRALGGRLTVSADLGGSARIELT